MMIQFPILLKISLIIAGSYDRTIGDFCYGNVRISVIKRFLDSNPERRTIWFGTDTQNISAQIDRGTFNIL